MRPDLDSAHRAPTANDPVPGAGEPATDSPDSLVAGAHGAPAAIPAAVWRLAVVVAFGAVMAGLDTSVANVGLETIGSDLGASLAAAQWITSGYLLALAGALPACGWVSRRVGAGRLWFWALAGFTVASGLCAIAPSIEALIAFRALHYRC
jgi:predicted MFS family arabinose efflux permease